MTIGQRVRVAGMLGTVRARHSLTVTPQWWVVLVDGSVLIVRDDECEAV